MQLISRRMPVDFNLFLFGDTHFGTRARSEEGEDALLDAFESSYEGLPASRNFGVHHGDAIEAIMVDDFRFDPGLSDIAPPMQQADAVVKKWKPYGKKIVCWLHGNHEWKLIRFGNLGERMARGVGCPYGTFSAKIRYLDHAGELMFKHYATHGRKSITSTADDPIRRETNKHLALKRHLKEKFGDCLLMSKGHTHQLHVVRPKSKPYLVDDGEKIRQRHTYNHRADEHIHADHRWYVNTGGFLLLYVLGHTGYAEAAEYDPTEIGYAVAMVRDREIVDIRPVEL